MLNEARGDEFVSHCAALVYRSAKDAGASEKVAATIERLMVAGMRDSFGGATVYIARRKADSSELAAEVFAEARAGKSVKQIATHRNLSERYIYRLIGRERDRLATLQSKPKKRHCNG